MTNETKVVEQRIIQRLIKTAADYELGGSLYSQVIPLHTQAYAIYDSQEKSGLYYVFGDGVHTYTEIRDGQSSLESSHEYAVFDEAWIALINSKADLQYMNFELAKRQYISNLVNEITEENEKSTTLYPSNKAVSTLTNALQDNIDNEALTRANADSNLQTSINNEETARINAYNNLSNAISQEETTRTNRDTELSQDIDNEITARQNADIALNVSIEEESSRATNKENQIITNYTAADSTLSKRIDELKDDLVAENTRAIDAEEALDENKADKTTLAQEISDRQLNDTKIINNIWSNSTMDGGTFETKYTANDGSYALLFNESDGGGTQYYNKSLDSLQYVGVNDGNDGVYVQIYAKNKTTNEGARLAASPSGIFYTNGKKNGSYVATDEIVTKAVLSSAVDVKANSVDVYTKTEIDGKLTAAMHFKGTKATYNDLPTSASEGDVWNILDTGENYAWDGENWDKLSETIDLSPYALIEEVDEKILAEKDRREEADNALNQAMNAEKTRAEIAENSLQETKADKFELPTKTSELTNDSDFTTNAILQEQVTALTQQIKDLKLLIPTEVTDSSTARSAMTKSGKVTLVDDIDLGVLNISGGMFASNDTTINLNGYEIKAGPTSGRAMLLVRGTSKYTFNGKGQFIDTASDSSPVWCASVNASVTINNGTFIAQGHTETIYCELGTININGGVFKTEMEDKRYLLNCKDANFATGTANIIVKGGEFWDFDPSANPEGPDTSYVAEGYTVTSREEDGHTIYTVVKA